MENSRTSQEKLSAALSSVAFFVPLLMNVKTPFVIKYMKQGFIINVAELILAILLSILNFGLAGILSLVHAICVLTSIWLAYNAFIGNDYTIPAILENADKLIQKLGVGSWFSTK